MLSTTLNEKEERQIKSLTLEARHTLSLEISRKRRQSISTSLFIPKSTARNLSADTTSSAYIMPTKLFTLKRLKQLRKRRLSKHTMLAKPRTLLHPQSFPILRGARTHAQVKSTVESLLVSKDDACGQKGKGYCEAERDMAQGPNMPDLEALMDEQLSKADHHTITTADDMDLTNEDDSISYGCIYTEPATCSETIRMPALHDEKVDYVDRSMESALNVRLVTKTANKNLISKSRHCQNSIYLVPEDLQELRQQMASQSVENITLNNYTNDISDRSRGLSNTLMHSTNATEYQSQIPITGEGTQTSVNGQGTCEISSNINIHANALVQQSVPFTVELSADMTSVNSSLLKAESDGIPVAHEAPSTNRDCSSGSFLMDFSSHYVFSPETNNQMPTNSWNVDSKNVNKVRKISKPQNHSNRPIKLKSKVLKSSKPIKITNKKEHKIIPAIIKLWTEQERSNVLNNLRRQHVEPDTIESNVKPIDYTLERNFEIYTDCQCLNQNCRAGDRPTRNYELNLHDPTLYPSNVNIVYHYEEEQPNPFEQSNLVRIKEETTNYSFHQRIPPYNPANESKYRWYRNQCHSSYNKISGDGQTSFENHHTHPAYMPNVSEYTMDANNAYSLRHATTTYQQHQLASTPTQMQMRYCTNGVPSTNYYYPPQQLNFGAQPDQSYTSEHHFKSSIAAAAPSLYHQNEIRYQRHPEPHHYYYQNVQPRGEANNSTSYEVPQRFQPAVLTSESAYHRIEPSTYKDQQCSSYLHLYPANSNAAPLLPQSQLQSPTYPDFQDSYYQSVVLANNSMPVPTYLGESSF